MNRVSPKINMVQKIVNIEHELIDAAKRILKSASDPVSAVMQFLHERPDGTTLSGHVVRKVLTEAFGDYDSIPGLVKVLAGNVKEIIRHADVINIVNSHTAVEKWGKHLIRKKDLVKFEIVRENGKLVIKNIVGLVAVEHGIEVPLDKVTINPPKLEVSLKLGILQPKHVVDIV